MKTFGIFALGGAMGIQFEDLNYSNLREAYLQVLSLIHLNQLRTVHFLYMKLFANHFNCFGPSSLTTFDRSLQPKTVHF